MKFYIRQLISTKLHNFYGIDMQFSFIVNYFFYEQLVS